jgi:hypothetical protein
LRQWGAKALTLRQFRAFLELKKVWECPQWTSHRIRHNIGKHFLSTEFEGG